MVEYKYRTLDYIIILTIPDSGQSDWVVAFMNDSVVGSVMNDGHVGHDGHVTAKIT